MAPKWPNSNNSRNNGCHYFFKASISFSKSSQTCTENRSKKGIETTFVRSLNSIPKMCALTWKERTIQLRLVRLFAPHFPIVPLFWYVVCIGVLFKYASFESSHFCSSCPGGNRGWITLSTDAVTKIAVVKWVESKNNRDLWAHFSNTWGQVIEFSTIFWWPRIKPGAS